MRVIFLLLLLLQGITLFSQVQTSPMTVKEDYLKKSKNQKKVANILLIGGGALVATGLIFPRGEEERDMSAFYIYANYKNDGISAVLILTGTVAMLSSVPFYLASSKNKRRARAITVNMQNQDILIPSNSTLILKRQPSVTLKLPL